MSATPPPPSDRASRAPAFPAVAAFVAGLIVAVLLVRALPPAPIYSPELARATYWQSYETSYFASLRAYEQPIRDALADGYIPIVVFGDSTIRGTGAVGEDVWTRQLEKRLQAVNSRVRVLNYAQNAGDLMGPFLYHHLQRKFPAARYIVQWHFSSEVGVRHQFHFWLTSEIALRDGVRNPAVARSFRTVKVARWDEQASFAMAALNIVTRYLDAGNWVRYRWLGRSYFDGDRKVKIQSLQVARESDIAINHFIAPDAAQMASMRGFFLAHQQARANYVAQPRSGHEAYFAEMFPAAQRSHLLLLTLDFNPFYAPREDAAQLATWRTMWTSLRAEMARIPDLNWVSLTGSAGELDVDDFVDLGHLTVAGQRRLVDAVAGKLLAPGGWFDPATPGAETPPDPLKDRWVETQSLKPYQLLPFQHMSPQPSRFFSSFGPGLDTTYYNAHPQTRLVFRAPAGRRRLQTTVRFNPAAYELLPEDEATDGIQLEIAVLGPRDQRTVVFSRLVDPWHVAADRGPLPVDVTMAVPAGAEVELFIGPGTNGRNHRDWAHVGPLTLK